MKATGIVRKIDELGRIVIPKEIRKTMRIKEGEPLEIFVGDKEEIVLKKYDPLLAQKNQIEEYIESIATITGLDVCVTDMKEIVMAEGSCKKQALNKPLTEEVIEIIEKRNIYYSKNNVQMKIIKDMNPISIYAISPIISDSDLIGSIIIMSPDISKVIGQSELVWIQVASGYLGKLI